MANKIKLRRGLSTNINSLVLEQGELAITTDTAEIYSRKGSATVKVVPTKTSELNNDAKFSTEKYVDDSRIAYFGEGYNEIECGFPESDMTEEDMQRFFGTYGMYFMNSELGEWLSAGSLYKVTYNNVEYQITANSGDGNVIWLGNRALIQDSPGEDTGEPFCVFVYQGSGQSSVRTRDENAQITIVKLSRVVEKYVDKDLLPEEAVLESEITPVTEQDLATIWNVIIMDNELGGGF